MARPVTCSIVDRPDGRFDVVAAIRQGKEIRREGFATLAEADEWVEGLRFLMGALGAPVALDPAGPEPKQARATCLPAKSRADAPPRRMWSG